MTTAILLKKLWLDGKDVITSEEMERYCGALKTDPAKSLRSLLASGKMIGIFRGVYYVKTPEELELGRMRYNHLELVAKGMAAKGVKNWYFGLYTALKLNNMTHEYFNVDYLVNDTISRPRPMKAAGSMFRFVKFKPSLFGFGVAGDPPHSDPEKTVLDLIYLWRYNGVPDGKILADVEEYARHASKSRIREYAKRYPKSVAELAAAL